MLVTDLVAERDYEGMSAWLTERYGMEVPGHFVTDALLYAAMYTDDPRNNPEVVHCRLRHRLYVLGCFEIPFHQAKEDDFKVTWNELHIFVDRPPETYDLSYDPSGYLQAPTDEFLATNLGYVRSKITKTETRIRPLNKTAQNLAPEPGAREWASILEDNRQADSRPERQAYQP
jgi:hypothetical protein